MKRVSVCILLCAALSCAGEGGKAADKPTDKPTDRPTGVSEAVRDTARTFVYRCEEAARFVVRIESDSVRLFPPPPAEAVPLRLVVSASGAKYSDGSTTFWSKGDEALIETEAGTFRECRSRPGEAVWDHARLNGVDFRAIGQEPGWLLDIDEDGRIVLLANYAEDRYVFPAPEPEVDREAGRTVYQAQTENTRLEIVIEDRPCRDAMSGQPYPATVTLDLDGNEYRGCGQPLNDRRPIPR